MAAVSHTGIWGELRWSELVRCFLGQRAALGCNPYFQGSKGKARQGRNRFTGFIVAGKVVMGAEMEKAK